MIFSNYAQLFQRSSNSVPYRLLLRLCKAIRSSSSSCPCTFSASPLLPLCLDNSVDLFVRGCCDANTLSLLKMAQLSKVKATAQQRMTVTLANGVESELGLCALAIVSELERAADVASVFKW